ncbi:MAG: Bacterial domain [Bacteroidota bacterium]|jgi:hypothetical protein
MTFYGKRDHFLFYVWASIAIIYMGVAFLIYWTEQDSSPIYILGGVWILMGLLFRSILRTTKYSFLEDHLLCQSLFFKKRIYYTSFRKIEKANGFYAGWKMNTAWLGYVIVYNKYDELLISPENEELFCRLFEEKKRAFSTHV